MSDIVDDDFRIFPLTRRIAGRFPLGQVLIAAETADEVDPAFVEGCLRRHAAGDWGEVDQLGEWGNAGTLQGAHRMPIVSRFRISGRPLQIVTSADGSVTSIILYARDLIRPAS